MQPLVRLAAVLRAAGHLELSSTVLHGARWWQDPLPWELREDQLTWVLDHSDELGWHVVNDEGEVITSDGLLVDADSPANGHYTVRIAKDHWACLKHLGDGVASVALRDAILMYLRHHGRVR